MDNFSLLSLIKRYIKTFIGIRFIRYVGILFTSNITSQIVIYSSIPIVTRLYSPKDFGVFAIFGALVGLLTKFSSFSYSQAILLPRTDTEAFRLVQLSAIIIFVFSISLFVIFINKNWIATLFHLSEHIFWFYLVPLGVAFVGYRDLLMNWHIRNKQYKIVGLGKIIEAFVSVSIKILLGIYLGSCVGGLISGFLGGVIASIIFLGIKFNYNIKNKETFWTLRNVAIKYKKFPIFVSFAQALNVLSEKIIIFIFALFFPKAVIGNYNLTQRTITNSINLLSDAVQKVYFQKSAAQVTKNIPILPDLKKLIKTLVFLGFPPFIFLFIAGRSIFMFIFGDQWATAGTYAQITAPWFYLRFITNPARLVFYVYHRQEILVVMNFLALCGGASALVIASILFKSAKIALIYFVCIGSTTEILTCVLAFREAAKYC